ncbi:MAG: HAD family phosphatase [Eubacteriales bacterium]
MLGEKKAVIFDLDGTLIDSMWVWSTVDEIYMEKYKIVKPDDFHEVMEGISYTEVAQYFQDEFNLSLTVEEIKQEWLDMTIEMYRNEVQLKEGVQEFLASLRQQGIRLGIATSSTRELVEAVLEGRGVRHYFDAICTSCEVNTGKPAPDVYLRVAEMLAVSPAECLVFEDVPKGVMAGKNAGMQVTAVEDEGNLSQRQQLRKLADYYISTYRDVLKNTYEVL